MSNSSRKANNELHIIKVSSNFIILFKILNIIIVYGEWTISHMALAPMTVVATKIANKEYLTVDFSFTWVTLDGRNFRVPDISCLRLSCWGSDRHERYCHRTHNYIMSFISSILVIRV